MEVAPLQIHAAVVGGRRLLERERERDVINKDTPEKITVPQNPDFLKKEPRIKFITELVISSLGEHQVLTAPVLIFDLPAVIVPSGKLTGIGMASTFELC
jgi:hypothetical protein